MKNQEKTSKNFEILYTFEDAYNEIKEARDKLNAIINKLNSNQGTFNQDTYLFITSVVQGLNDWLENIDIKRNESAEKVEKNENPWPNL